MKKIKNSELEETLNNFLPFDNMFTVNKDMIFDILNSSELKSINKGEFFINSLLEKINNYNDLYLKEFDDTIDEFLESTGELDLMKLSRIIKMSTRLCSELYDNFMYNLAKL